MGNMDQPLERGGISERRKGLRTQVAHPPAPAFNGPHRVCAVTWTHERSFVKPYLNIWGERGTGKSSVIESALVFLCRYAQYYGGAVTPASLLRSIDEIQGTSILDESDFRSASKEALESNDLLLRILRGGYKQSGCYSLAEKEGTKHFPTVYRIGNPKIIIGRRVIQDDAL